MKKILLFFALSFLFMFLLPHNHVSAYEIPDWYYDPDVHYASLGVGNGSYCWVEVNRQFSNQESVAFIFEESTEYIRINMPAIAGGYQSRFELWFADGSLQIVTWEEILGFDDANETYSIKSKRVMFAFDLAGDRVVVTGAKETYIEYNTLTNLSVIDRILCYTYFTSDNIPGDLDYRIFFPTPLVKFNLFVQGNLYSSSLRNTMLSAEPTGMDEPEGYSFAGWQAINGDILVTEDFTGINDFTDAWLLKTASNYELNLYAVFESDSVPGHFIGGYSLIETPAENVPTWLSGFLEPFRLHTTMGFIIVYFLLLIAFIIFVSMKHLAPGIILGIYVIYNIFWFWLGVLPFYVIIISGLLIVMVMVFRIKENRGQHYEE